MIQYPINSNLITSPCIRLSLRDWLYLYNWYASKEGPLPPRLKRHHKGPMHGVHLSAVGTVEDHRWAGSPSLQKNISLHQKCSVLTSQHPHLPSPQISSQVPHWHNISSPLWVPTNPQRKIAHCSISGGKVDSNQMLVFRARYHLSRGVA